MRNIFTSLKRARSLRAYSLATAVYVGVASLIIVPIIERHITTVHVKNQLTSIISQNDKVKSSALPPTVAEISDKPTFISIDRLNIHLPVASGFYNFNTHLWTLDSKHVFTSNFSTKNPAIGTAQTDTLVFYGHDIPGILKSTSGITYGDILTIDTQNGYTFRYYFDRDKVVDPTNTSILTEK